MSQETADLVTFTEEILDGKLHFLCIDNNNKKERFIVFLGKNLVACRRRLWAESCVEKISKR